MSITVILIATTMLTQGAEAVRSPLSYCRRIPYERIQTPSKEMIRVRINNGNKTETFLTNPNTTATELYQDAESLGITDPMKINVLWDYRGSIIPNNSSLRILDIVSRGFPSLPNSNMPRELILYVFAPKQIEITIHITNGDITQTLVVNAGTRTRAVHRRAIRLGILKNTFQFMLKYRHEKGRVLPHYANTSAPGQTMLHCVDPQKPRELNLIVSRIPEGALLFAMLEGMRPNDDIPSWKYALFCIQNPWHRLCSSLSRMSEYHDSSKEQSNGERTIQDFTNGIYVVDVSNWSGTLHLGHVPRSVRSMVLKGKSVRVNFETLRFSFLKELTLDFDEVIGLDIEALSGSTLEVLRLSSDWGIQKENDGNILDMLNAKRAHNEIRLEMIHFDRSKRDQQIIWYDSTFSKYKLWKCVYASDGDSIFDYSS